MWKHVMISISSLIEIHARAVKYVGRMAVSKILLKEISEPIKLIPSFLMNLQLIEPLVTHIIKQYSA